MKLKSKITAKYNVVEAGPGAGVEVKFDGDISWNKHRSISTEGDKIVFESTEVDVIFSSYYNSKRSEGAGLHLKFDDLTGDEYLQDFEHRMGAEGSTNLDEKKVMDSERNTKLILSGGYTRSEMKTGDTFSFRIELDKEYHVLVSGTATFLDSGSDAWADIDEPDDDDGRFEDKLHATHKPGNFYTDYDNLPAEIKTAFESVKPVVDRSRYTVFEPTAFLRLKGKDIEGVKYNLEIHLGKLEEDADENHAEEAMSLKENLDWTIETVYLDEIG